ncbi:MAG: hypothetical protein V3U84_02240 [Thiotrichaceae bacterium]
MTTINVEIYDALRSINVPEDKARKAAEAMSSDKTDVRFARIEGELALIKWIQVFTLAAAMSIVWKVFS